MAVQEEEECVYVPLLTVRCRYAVLKQVDEVVLVQEVLHHRVVEMVARCLVAAPRFLAPERPSRSNTMLDRRRTRICRRCQRNLVSSTV